MGHTLDTLSLCSDSSLSVQVLWAWELLAWELLVLVLFEVALFVLLLAMALGFLVSVL